MRIPTLIWSYVELQEKKTYLGLAKAGLIFEWSYFRMVLFSSGLIFERNSTVFVHIN